ncbi:MAG TPA: metal ABC transporter substrate-binding protein [Cyanobacteria bacterium UBA9273]|nr:metal ABC transporter substrate-binding protein [Cyanobacteria bacterium UBA9273]
MVFLKIRNLGSTLVIALALGITSCSESQQTTKIATTASPSSAEDSKPKVVATTSVLCDITRSIAKESVDLSCLMPAGVDPHVYEAKPSDRKAIEQASLILYSGYNFEPHLIQLIKATQNNAAKVAVSEIAVSSPLTGEEHEHNHETEAKTEPDHSEFDPHVWHNAQNGIRMIEVIRDRLGKLSPELAAEYTSNAETMTKELTQLDLWIKSQINTIPANQRKLVTTHAAMNYYATAYGISLQGALSSLSTEEKPTAGRVKELVQQIEQAGVPTIFPEATINPKLIETVAREANVKVSDQKLFVDGLGEKGTEGDTYQKMLVANTKAIVEGLGGNYTPFQE